jgi:hypothetical protein
LLRLVIHPTFIHSSFSSIFFLLTLFIHLRFSILKTLHHFVASTFPLAFQHLIPPSFWQWPFVNESKQIESSFWGHLFFNGCHLHSLNAITSVNWMCARTNLTLEFKKLCRWVYSCIFNFFFWTTNNQITFLLKAYVHLFSFSHLSFAHLAFRS